MMCNVGVIVYFDVLYWYLPGKAEEYCNKSFRISGVLHRSQSGISLKKSCFTAWPYPFRGSRHHPHQYFPTNHTHTIAHLPHSTQGNFSRCQL